MLKKTIVLILAACILFCTASFAETTPEGKQAPADKIVYENEYLTVRMGSIAVEEDSVTVPLSFDATGKRTCVVVSDITEEMLTNMDSIEALRKIRQIQGGNAVPNAAPGETIECRFIWDSTGSYDRSIFMDILEKIGITLEPETIEVEPEGFPKGLTAVLTILLHEPELDVIIASKTGLDPSSCNLIRLRFASAD